MRSSPSASVRSAFQVPVDRRLSIGLTNRPARLRDQPKHSEHITSLVTMVQLVSSMSWLARWVAECNLLQRATGISNIWRRILLATAPTSSNSVQIYFITLSRRSSNSLPRHTMDTTRLPRLYCKATGTCARPAPSTWVSCLADSYYLASGWFEPQRQLGRSVPWIFNCPKKTSVLRES